MVLAGLSLGWRRELLSLWDYHSLSGALGTHFLCFSKNEPLGDRDAWKILPRAPRSVSALLLELHSTWSPAKLYLVWELVRPCYMFLTPDENKVLQFCKTSHLDSLVFLVSIWEQRIAFWEARTLSMGKNKMDSACDVQVRGEPREDLPG